MHIFYLTLVYTGTLAISFIIGFYFNKSQSNWWRKILGITFGFISSLALGSLSWLGISLLIDQNTDIPLTLINAIAKTFWFALIGSIYGTYQGNKRIKY